MKWVEFYLEKQGRPDSKPTRDLNTDKLYSSMGNFIYTGNVDDEPVSGNKTSPISSNWAYNHSVDQEWKQYLYEQFIKAIITMFLGTDFTEEELEEIGWEEISFIDVMEALSGRAMSTFDWAGQSLTGLNSLITNLNNPRDLTINCGTEKTPILTQPVWNDINIGGSVLAGIPGLEPGRDEFVDSLGADTGIDTYSIAVGEALDGSFELMHDYKEGTDLYFHIHWQGIAAPTGTDYVRWRLTYVLARDGVVLPSVTQIEIETEFDTQYEFKRSDFAAITGTDFKIGDQFLFRIERIASTGDAYAGEALLATVGVHYQIDTIGSRTTYIK